MAIKKVFGGQSLLRPASYSQTSAAPQGVPLVGDNTALIVGEAAKGGPGDTVGYKVFSAEQFANLAAYYGSGPIVDAANAAINPAKAGQGINGAQQIIVWKTNSSTQASVVLQNATPANVMTITDANWGTAGNFINVAVANGTDTAKQRTFTITSPSKTETLGQNPATAQLTIHYLGSDSTCTLSIAGASDAAKTLTTTTGGTSGDNMSIPLAGLSINDLVNRINTFNSGATYIAVLSNTLTGTITPATDLDIVTAVTIKASPASFYRLQHEMLDLVNTSTQVVATLAATPVAALIAPIKINLSGGALGPSVNADFAAGFDNSLAQDYNAALAAISQDATADIALGVTDPSSTYTIASVLAAQSSHLILRSNLKNRKEAQGFCGMRSSTKSSVYAEAQTLGNYLMTLCLEDEQVVDVITGSLTWKQPHIQAAQLMGMRLGTDIGTPLTHKFLNCFAIGHYVNPTTGIATGDFNPDLDYDAAITAGVTFAETFQGSFRVVVDNTTYGVDDSFVFNRGSVVQAAQYIAQQLRLVGDTLFVGTKISAGAASSIKTAIKAKMQDLLTAQIVTPTDDFPLGYDADDLLVTISGNSATVNILVIPVQGLDFVLIQLALGDIVQTA